MLINYSNFSQGDLIIVEMHFSNQEESKLRPALVISSNDHNQHSEDIIVLKISSKARLRPFSVPLTQRDLSTGQLLLESVVLADFPVVILKTKVIKKIGVVNPKIISQVKEKLKLVFGI